MGQAPGAPWLWPAEFQSPRKITIMLDSDSPASVPTNVPAPTSGLAGDATSGLSVSTGGTPYAGAEIRAYVLVLSAGLAAGLLSSLASLPLVEMVLFSFQRIPFTSSYLPGRRPLVDVVLGYSLAAILYVSILAALIGTCTESGASTSILAAILLVVWYGLRHARRTSYEIHRLEFEELPEPIVETLSIEKD